MFRRVRTKDLLQEQTPKLFMGAQGVSEVSEEELEKFFSEEERQILKAASEAGQIVKTHVISDSTLDRHSDTVNVDGWDLKSYTGVVLLNHGHIGFAGVRETTLPIARSVKQWRYAGQLKSTAIFTSPDIYEFGHTVGKLVDAGFLPGASVGFIPHEWERNKEREEETGRRSYDFKSQELVEYSIVQVGSNRNALVEEGLQDTISTSLEGAFSGAKQAGIDTSSVADEMERFLDDDPDHEKFKAFCERLYFEHKTGIFHAVTESPDRKSDEDDFLADIQEMFNGR